MSNDNVVNALFKSIKVLIEDSRENIVRNVNVVMVVTYFNIGRLIVEREQKGQSRATYGKETLKNLSRRLNKEFGRGYSADNLQSMRIFYLEYSKSETLSPILTVRPGNMAIYETASRISDPTPNLSWSHYIQLLKIVVWIKGRRMPLTGTRKYLAYEANDVVSLVNQSLLKYYYQDDILKIEVSQIETITKPDKKR